MGELDNVAGTVVVSLLEAIINAVMQYRGSRRRLRDREEFMNALGSLTTHLDRWKRTHAHFFELDNDNLTNIIHQIDNGDLRSLQPYVQACDISVQRFRMEIQPFFANHGFEPCEVHIDGYMGIVADNMIRMSRAISRGREHILNYQESAFNFSFADLILYNERGVPFLNQELYPKIVTIQHLATNIVGVSDTVMRESIPILDFLIKLLVR
ncbi:hypothetical protein ACFL6S_15415 [Candidatus Poribacteria bacterium]